MHALNVDGARNVLQMEADLRVPKIVHTRTVGVFGNTRGMIVDEGYRIGRERIKRKGIWAGSRVRLSKCFASAGVRNEKAKKAMTNSPNAITQTIELNLAWQNRDGKVTAQFEVQIRDRTEPPSVPKYRVELVTFRAARWWDNACDNCGTELQTELPAALQPQVARLLGSTLSIPPSILDNKLTYYIDPPRWNRRADSFWVCGGAIKFGL